MAVPASVRNAVRLVRCVRSARALRDAPAFAMLLHQRTRQLAGALVVPNRELVVHPKIAGGRPVFLRTGTADIGTYREAVLKRYHMPDGLRPDVSSIIDMGANIGLVSLDLARVFPEAIILAVEMDGGNFELLKRNVAGLADRVTALHAAVWSHSRGVCYSSASDDNAFAASEGSRVVGEKVCAPSVTPMELLHRFEGSRVGYVKMDIEGGEDELLLRTEPTWLDGVDAISVEVHRGVSAEAIAKVLSSAGFNVRALTRHPNALEGQKY